MTESFDATFAMSLLEVQGVGRVAANRILRHFDSLADLGEYPREQLMHRLAGLPNAADTTTQLQDASTMSRATSDAAARIERHSKARVLCIPCNSSAFPEPLRALDDRDRPVVLYVYGKLADSDLADGPKRRRVAAAFLGSSPIEPNLFERSQELAVRVSDAGATVILGAESGFDVALSKRVVGHGGKAVLVVGAGIDKIPRELRAAASTVVKAGGGIVSPFPLGHGPFDHDHVERSRLMASLARATVVCNLAPSTDARSAALWSLDNQRATFALAPIEGMDDVHVIESDIDAEWLVSAVANPGQAT